MATAERRLDPARCTLHKAFMSARLDIGDVSIPGRVWAAPMTGITDLPFRRLLFRLGAPYAATEMVACAELARGRPDAARRAAVGEGLPLMAVQLVGREAGWIAAGAKLAAAAGAEVIDLNMGCPAREVTGGLSGSALMRDLDHAETLIWAAVEASPAPVTLKMRLGWDDRSRNAPELARRAERTGVRAITVHGRTRMQFYKGAADWRAVADVKAATRLPVIVNGDVTDLDAARRALELSGADAVMIGRGLCGRPWLTAQLDAVICGRAAPPEPGPRERLEIVLGHLEDNLDFYGERLGLKVFRKHLAWYVERAPWPACAVARRVAKAELCRIDQPAEVERRLARLWLDAEDIQPCAA
jgi:nifR3 family TIM-barrel protein